MAEVVHIHKGAVGNEACHAQWCCELSPFNSFTFKMATLPPLSQTSTYKAILTQKFDILMKTTRNQLDDLP
jgi:hypothetical protein